MFYYIYNNSCADFVKDRQSLLVFADSIADVEKIQIDEGDTVKVFAHTGSGWKINKATFEILIAVVDKLNKAKIETCDINILN